MLPQSLITYVYSTNFFFFFFSIYITISNERRFFPLERNSLHLWKKLVWYCFIYGRNYSFLSLSFRIINWLENWTLETIMAVQKDIQYIKLRKSAVRSRIECANDSFTVKKQVYLSFIFKKKKKKKIIWIQILKIYSRYLTNRSRIFKLICVKRLIE